MVFAFAFVVVFVGDGVDVGTPLGGAEGVGGCLAGETRV